MRWKFWQKPGPKELPVMVKSALMSQFRLASPSVDKMRACWGDPDASTIGKWDSSEFLIRRSFWAGQRLK